MQTNEPWVAGFSELDKRDIAKVGGKGANLGELTQAGFPVPGGFCVTTLAFREFLKGAGDTRALFSRLAAVNPEDTEAVRRLGEEVRSQLRQAPIPNDVARAVEAAWRKAGAEHAYAVRSSATAEDLPSPDNSRKVETEKPPGGRKQLRHGFSPTRRLHIERPKYNTVSAVPRPVRQARRGPF